MIPGTDELASYSPLQARPRLSRGKGGGAGRRARYRAEKKGRIEARLAREQEARDEKVLYLSDAVSVAELAAMLNQPSAELIKKLIGIGQMVSLNQRIDLDTASILVAEFGYELKNPEEPEEDEEATLAEGEEGGTDEGAEGEDEAGDEEIVSGELSPRPAVITVMGHVDHGKTSILDRIRKSDVVAGEAGGITQHIGAYQVVSEGGDRLTFIDTPGHEAFTAMRAQGAQVTDMVVLVVAADDGVMPQTKEAIHHARAAGCPIMVAMNKIDAPGRDDQRVYQGLAAENLVPEAWGGSTVVVPVSARTGEGIPDLVEMIALQTQMLELSSDPSADPVGVVLESRLDKGLGPVATVLVQEGTLEKGMSFVAGTSMGRVRLLRDWDGNPVDFTGPGTPVEVIGWQDVPEINTQFQVCEDDAEARSLVEARRERMKNQVASGESKKLHASLENLFAAGRPGEKKSLNFVVKADVQGSATALADSLVKLSNDEVEVRVVHSGVGAPNDGDVMLAAASDAVLLSFHVRPPASVRKLSEQHGVQIKAYDIIYECLEEIEKAVKGLLEPTYEEHVVGSAEVRQVFSVPKFGKIAGSYVLDGKIARNCKARVLRDGVPVWSGAIASLKRFKDDVREVQTGFECGIGLDGFNDLKPQDVIEVIESREVAR